MKNGLVLFLLSMHCTVNFAQNNDTLVTIKGYYYTFFKKDEIVFSFEQKIKKLQEEAHSVSIDFTQSSFFIPTQIGDKVIANDSLKISLDSIYFMPNSHSVDYVKKLFGKELNLAKEICILSECNKTSLFYTFANNDNILFKCFYIEGFAMEKQIANVEKERFNVNVDIYSINKNAEYLKLFFIICINSYSVCIDNPKMQLWQPYLD